MTTARTLTPTSAGLGLRRPQLGSLQAAARGAFDFLECAPDNWIGVGGRWGDALRELSERHPLVCHGLSLSLGAAEPFERAHLARLRRFLDDHAVTLYSEHLSYCSSGGQLYDLLPLPFTDDAVRHFAARIGEVQDALGRRIAVENISYYAAPYAAMDEIDFIEAVLAEADCDLLLDVNNVYVNSINHRYDAHEFLRRLPADRIAYFHVAGHHDEADDLKIDTHGAAVIPAVFDLLRAAVARFGPRPTVLERDFDPPPFPDLLAELAQVRGVLVDGRA